MSRKDYEAIARAIREARFLAEGDAEQRVIDMVSRSLVVELQRDNPRFNRAKFLEAAEYQALEA